VAKRPEHNLEPKRMLRVGVDFALGLMRAAAQGTVTFVDARKEKVPFPESASKSVQKFFESAEVGADQAGRSLAEQRREQAEESHDGDLSSRSRSDGRPRTHTAGVLRSGAS
jgi:hypothetical protein